MNKTKKLTLYSDYYSDYNVSSGFIYIPVGFAKIFPIQHFANVLSAVLLGPWYAVAQAFITSTLRNMHGNWRSICLSRKHDWCIVSGHFYSKSKKIGLAVVGEVIGTGILGAIATYPIAVLLLGREATLFGLIPAFTLSSFTGALMGYGLLKVFIKNKALGGMILENSTHDRRL